MSVAGTLFFLSVASILYTYALYPALLIAFGPRRTDSARPEPREDSALPAVTVVLSAFNEEDCIGARIENLLAQDYPADKLHVLVGSDGSADQTAAIVRPYVGERVQLLDFKENRGKATVLNDLVAASRTEILVFTDANTDFADDAVRRLAAWFQDSAVVAVSGELKITAGGEAAGEGLYWRVEQQLKRIEGAIGGLLGANGAIYALRRDVYEPLPPDTVCDDFVIVMNAAMTGNRVVYDESAVAFEEASDVAGEYKRRIRIGVGNYRALFRHPQYFSQSSAARLFTYVSHKVLRWLVPLFMIVAVLSAGVMRHESAFFALAFWGQLLFYAAIYLAYRTREQTRWPGIVTSVVHIVVLNVAFAHGFWRFLVGPNKGTWARTERSS